MLNSLKYAVCLWLLLCLGSVSAQAQRVVLVLDMHSIQSYTAANDLGRLPALQSLLRSMLPLMLRDTDVALTSSCVDSARTAAQSDLNALLVAAQSLQPCENYNVSAALAWAAEQTVDESAAVIWIADGKFDLGPDQQLLTTALETLHAGRACLYVLPLGSANVRTKGAAGYVDDSMARNLVARAGCGEAYPPQPNRSLVQPFLEVYTSLLGGKLLNSQQNQIFANPPTRFALSADVPPETGLLRWDAVWQSDKLGFHLVPPAGETLKDDQIKTRLEDGSVTVLIDHPAPGSWQFDLDGSELAGGQQTATIVVGRFDQPQASVHVSPMLEPSPSPFTDEEQQPQSSPAMAGQMALVGGGGLILVSAAGAVWFIRRRALARPDATRAPSDIVPSPLPKSSTGHAPSYVLQPHMPQAALVVVTGSQPGQRFEIRTPVVTIGRHSTNHMILADRSVSRFHGRLWYDEYQYTYWLANLTQGGVWVNQQPIQQPYPLRGGEYIQFGTVQLYFEVLAGL